MGVRLALLLKKYFLAKSVPDMATLGNGGLSGVAGQVSRAAMWVASLHAERVSCKAVGWPGAPEQKKARTDWIRAFGKGNDTVTHSTGANAVDCSFQAAILAAGSS